MLTKSQRQLAIAIPPSERKYWNVANYFPDSVAIYTASASNSGDLIVEEYLNCNPEINPIFFLVAFVEQRNRFFHDKLKKCSAYRDLFFGALDASINYPINPDELTKVVLGNLSQYLSPLASYAADQVHSLSSLRKEYETLNQRFVALESYMQRAGIGLVRERLYVPLARKQDGSAIFVRTESGSIQQRLPVSSKGLCAIDVFARVAPSEEDSQLRAQLVLGGNLSSKAVWTVTLPAHPEPRETWISLALSRSLEGVDRTVQFQLDFDDPSQIEFGVSGLLANPEYCAHDGKTGANIGNRPVAMRLWEAPPGMLVPRSPTVVLSDMSAIDVERSRRLTGQTLQKIRPIYPDNWNPGFEAVSYIGNEDQLTVHPPNHGICIGALDRLVSPKAASVTTTARVAHESANPVEFNIAIGGAEDGDGVPWDEAPILKDIVCSSGWRTIPPKEIHQLIAILPPSVKEKENLTLFFLTRMGQGKANSFAWARFSDVVIEQAQ